MERAFLIAYAMAVVAVPRPVSDRPSFGLYVPPDLRCNGPQSPTQLVRDALWPDDDDEHLCGTLERPLENETYAWSRRSLYKRSERGWAFVARSEYRIARLLALPNGGFAIVGEDDVLMRLSGDDHRLIVDDHVLHAYDAARALSRAEGRPPPLSPLHCLATAYAGALTLRRGGDGSEPGFSVSVTFVGNQGRVEDNRADTSRALFTADARREIARVTTVLASDASARNLASVSVSWECDGARRAMHVGGARAAALYDVAHSWR